MGGELLRPNPCPACQKPRQSRKRDMGKVCNSCNMGAIASAYAHTRIKPDKPTPQEHCRAHRERYKDDLHFRMARLLSSAKARASKSGVEVTITLDELIALYPKDGLCPVLKTPMQFNSAGKGRRDDSPSLDRTEPRGGYVIGNVRVISWRANRLKSNAEAFELEAIAAYMRGV